MDITETRRDGLLIIDLAGRLDSNTSDEVDRVLTARIAEGAPKLLIDFQGVGYISSAGLRILLRCAKGMKASKGTLVLSSLDGSVFEVFEMSGLAKLFTFARTREDGIGMLT